MSIINKKRIITIGRWVLWFASVVILAFLITTFVAQRVRVDGSSMEPTLSDGNSRIMEKVSYKFHDPDRYDVVVFPYRYEQDTYYIKRIIGLPGETIQIKNGCVYIDGEKLDTDTYGMDAIEDGGTASEPITLGSDEYFVMGDNRNNSHDSRYADVGVITKKELMGRVLV